MKNNINVYTSFYVDNNIIRNDELEFCYKHNTLNKNIFQFNAIPSNHRLMYSDFIRLINQSTSENDINIIANSDIYFNDTIQLCNGIKKNQCYALSRWDQQMDGSIQHFCRADSQDVWIFRGPIKQIVSDFNLGWRGCDNRFAYELKRAGYNVINPSKSIQTIHLHLSAIRNYTLSDSLVPGPYLTIEPCHL